MDAYQNFLRSKIVLASESGIKIDPTDINDKFIDGTVLKPHQKDAIIWAIRGGCRALFESFGLGKTIQQLIICQKIIEHDPGKSLIIAPLGVKQEFYNDAENKLGIKLQYVKTLAECKSAETPYLITNYERVRDGDIDPNYFKCTSLDEASVLRSYGSKTYQEFLKKFKDVKYKFVATATPSPNKYKELIHYAGYLGIMDTGQALTRFFHRDSTKANNLTLYPHKEQEFWLWVSSWALFITKPSDLGYDDDGYELPPLNIRYHKTKVDHTTAGTEQNGQVKMFRDAALSLKDASKEKRDSIDDRIAQMLKIVKETKDDEQIVIWCDLDSEQNAIEKILKFEGYSYTSLRGSHDIDYREEQIKQWKNKQTKCFVSKPVMYGSGINMQQAHIMIFVGIGYKFADFIQAIHREYRFMQKHIVDVNIIYAESEDSILKTLLSKWEQHNHLVEQMIKIIKENGLNIINMETKLARSIGIKREETTGQFFKAVLNDNVIECKEMEDNSIDLIHTSIPFSNHYEYTPSYNDFGHNKDNDAFFEQMDFLTPELLRILKPGRVCAVHVKDRILFGNATGDGMPTVDPFSDMTVFHYLKHGFRYFGRITIVTDVVRENNQTYRLGWTEQCKDGSKMGVGCPEYILLFRKLPTDTSRAYADEPVKKSKDEYTRAQWQIDAHGFWRSSGNRLAMFEDFENIEVSKLQNIYRKWSRGKIYEYKDHVDLAKNLDIKNKLPAAFMVVAPGSWSENVWDDVNRMITLNSRQAAKNLQMHICPLQLDIVDRIINRFSNKGDLVLDPFGGLMTVPYVAIKSGRRGIGIELNIDSYIDGVTHLKNIEEKIFAPTLFDVIEEDETKETENEETETM